MSDEGRCYVETVPAGESVLWRDGPPLLPRLDIELTERCDNDCLHCCIDLPEGDTDARWAEMTTAEVETVLGDAAALGALSVRFTGGEPLLRDDFEHLYLHARRLGLKVLLFTNARLVTREVADLLQRVPPLEPVEVSVYGMHVASYDAVARRRGAFDEFRRGVALLIDRGVPLVVKGVVLPPTRLEMDEFEEWAKTVAGAVRPPSYVAVLDLRARRDSPERNRRIAALRLSPKDVVGVLSRRRESYLRDMREFCGRFLGAPGDILFACGAGQGACVDAYGRAQMCLPLRHPDTVFDLRDEGAGGSLESGRLRRALVEFFPRLRELRAHDPEYLRRCARCFLKGLCEQCPAKSWSEHGTLDTPVEYLCDVAHTQARDLGLLGDDEHGWEVDDRKERVERL